MSKLTFNRLTISGPSIDSFQRKYSSQNEPLCFIKMVEDDKLWGCRRSPKFVNFKKVKDKLFYEFTTKGYPFGVFENFNSNKISFNLRSTSFEDGKDYTRCITSGDIKGIQKIVDDETIFFWSQPFNVWVMNEISH